jgi:hypothetical protein
MQNFDSIPNSFDKIGLHLRHTVLYPLNQHFGDIGIGNVYGMVIMQPAFNNRYVHIVHGMTITQLL